MSNVVKNVEGLVISYLAILNIKQWLCFGKQFNISLKYLTQIYHLYNPVTEFLGVYPRKKKANVQKEICTQFFLIVAICLVAPVGDNSNFCQQESGPTNGAVICGCIEGQDEIKRLCFIKNLNKKATYSMISFI